LWWWIDSSSELCRCLGVVAVVAIRELVEIVQRLNVGAKYWQLHEFHFLPCLLSLMTGLHPRCRLFPWNYTVTLRHASILVLQSVWRRPECEGGRATRPGGFQLFCIARSQIVQDESCRAIENKILMLSEDMRNHPGEWQVGEVVTKHQAR